MRAKDPKVHYRRRVIEAAIGFVLGVGAVVAGFILKYPWLEAAGFAVMLACSAWAVASYRRMSGIVVDRRRSPERGGMEAGGRRRTGRQRARPETPPPPG